MNRIRRAQVIAISEPHPGLIECTVDVEGEQRIAVAYPDLTGPLEPGDTVVVNTTAVSLGLGTGGVHIVMAVEGRESGERAGHAMKLRYSPTQSAVVAVEEAHRDAISAIRSLQGLKVVVAGLHSAVVPALIGARATRPDARTCYVMTDQAALHIGFSKAVAAARAAGLLDVTITAGQATGGDLEAITLHGALAAAVAVARADVVVVAMGPGNIGTGSRWGFALLEVAAIVNAVGAMGGRPVVAPRVSFADQRPRHQGLSHHTTTALELALAPAEVVLPPMTPERAAPIRESLRALGRHTVVDVELGPAEEALERSPVPLRSMGRGFNDDPDAFRAAAAAGVYAAR